VIEIAARPVRALPLAGLVLGLLLLLQAVQNIFGLAGSRGDTLADEGIHNFLLSAAAAACLVRAFLVGRGRLTWLMFGLSLAVFAIGDVTWTLLYEDQRPVPSPTVSDGFWLAYYPFAVAGLVFLIRDRIDGFDLHRWIDGMAAALIMTTLGVIFFVDPVVKKAEDASALQTTLEFAYPICDVLILGAVAGTFALTAWRPGKTWLLLGIGLFMFTCADSISAVQSVEGTIDDNSYDFVWTAGALLIAWAAWRPYPAREPPAHLKGWKAVALPIACQVLAASIQVLALFRHLPESERLLTLLVLAIVTLQLWISRPRKPE
jgi:hypothetical protein